MHLISTEDIQYQPLVGIRELCILEEDNDAFTCIQHDSLFSVYASLIVSTGPISGYRKHRLP